ncbi:lipopolysaccharide biosynthesis protein [Geofilum sp. OHC36d9]|uniref:lipopolysaccharide biosynthesis protein n=1 Tax=Geofilum sp. OHC36d9 TaxID=3458413 RepID=UPI0040337592
MGVTLYTVRVVLSVLGEVDYGLYTVIGGVVTMFAFLSNTMASASQRFYSFELGRRDFVRLKQVFSLTFIIYVGIAIFILLLAETVGLWFLNTQMTIPADRLNAANWVYQFSVFAFVVNVLSIPYNAAIIARENMKAFAYISILEALLKLAIVYILVIFSFDKLKLYAVLMFGVTFLISFSYFLYAYKKYKECKVIYYWDRQLFSTLVSYSGWSLFGSLSGIARNHGVNILLNLFFNPIVNAARAIAYQVSNAISQFATNFSTAVRPQIIKYYASNETELMMQLVFKSSKFSFFLLYIFSLPLILETNFVLNIWLKSIPDYAGLFTTLVIVVALIDSLSYSMMTVAQATGKIRNYQIWVGGTQLMNLPVSYLFLKLGYPPESTMYVAIVFSVICLFIRLVLLKKMVGLNILEFTRDVLIRVALISMVSYGILSFIVRAFAEGWLRFITGGFISVIIASVSIFLIGLTSEERSLVIHFLKNKVNGKKR